MPKPVITGLYLMTWFGRTKNRVYDREQRAYHQALEGNYEPEQQRAFVSQQYDADAHLYLHRSKTVE